MVYTLVLMRHGESQWNKENRFTGWVDVPLSETGRAEALRAGKELNKENLKFDVVYTSVLKRAIKTTEIALEEADLLWIPVLKNWRLNERHYGGLQGLNKKETVEKHGEQQVQLWRRSYDVPPPPLDESSEYWSGRDPKYASLSPAEIPKSECLKDTVERVLPLWESEIAPAIKSGKRVLISAHGNSLRALVKHLDNIPPEIIAELNIPTSVPLVYLLDDDLRPIKQEGAWGPLSGRYLGDQEAIRAAIEGVAAQTGKK